MKVAAINLRNGNAVEMDGKLWVVLKYNIMQPGKGASVIQVEMRDLRSGLKTNVRFRTQEMVEKVRVDEAEFQYLYTDDQVHLMNAATYDQIPVPKELFGEQIAFLQEGMPVQVMTYEGQPISVEIPSHVTVTVQEADPVTKGQTASSSYKPAKVDGDVRVMVPPHIGAGTRIVVDTRDFSYVERAKD